MTRLRSQYPELQDVTPELSPPTREAVTVVQRKVITYGGFTSDPVVYADLPEDDQNVRDGTLFAIVKRTWQRMDLRFSEAMAWDLADVLTVLPYSIDQINVAANMVCRMDIKSSHLAHRWWLRAFQEPSYSKDEMQRALDKARHEERVKLEREYSEDGRNAAALETARELVRMLLQIISIDERVQRFMRGLSDEEYQLRKMVHTLENLWDRVFLEPIEFKTVDETAEQSQSTPTEKQPDSNEPLSNL